MELHKRKLFVRALMGDSHPTQALMLARWSRWPELKPGWVSRTGMRAKTAQNGLAKSCYRRRLGQNWRQTLLKKPPNCIPRSNIVCSDLT
jgi:hypothetical protein